MDATEILDEPEIDREAPANAAAASLTFKGDGRASSRPRHRDALVERPHPLHQHVAEQLRVLAVHGVAHRRERAVVDPLARGGDELAAWLDYRLENDPAFLERIAEARAAIGEGRGVPLDEL